MIPESKLCKSILQFRHLLLTQCLVQTILIVLMSLRVFSCCNIASSWTTVLPEPVGAATTMLSWKNSSKPNSSKQTHTFWSKAWFRTILCISLKVSYLKIFLNWIGITSFTFNLAGPFIVDQKKTVKPKVKTENGNGTGVSGVPTGSSCSSSWTSFPVCRWGSLIEILMPSWLELYVESTMLILHSVERLRQFLDEGSDYSVVAIYPWLSRVSLAEDTVEITVLNSDMDVQRVLALARNVVKQHLRNYFEVWLEFWFFFGSHVSQPIAISSNCKTIIADYQKHCCEITFGNYADIFLAAILEDVNDFIGNNCLLKRSLILIKSWINYETRSYSFNSKGLIQRWMLAKCCTCRAPEDVDHMDLRAPCQPRRAHRASSRGASLLPKRVC